jgi:hypothetical protein
MVVANATKHAVTEFRAIMGELMDQCWHVSIQSRFQFRMVVIILFFA